MLLLKLGARADMLDADGRTALDVARSSGMPTVMISRLRNLGADVEDGVGVGSQRHGETAEDAKKREMRAKKAEASAAQNWSTWRQAHPWRGLTPDTSTSAHHVENTTRLAQKGDDYYLPTSPRSEQGQFRAFSPRGDNVPLFVGTMDFTKAGEQGKKPGRIARLKSWASTSIRKRSKTPPPPQPRPQSARASRGVSDWSPMDSNMWAPSDEFK